MSIHNEKYLANFRKFTRRESKCKLRIFKWRIKRRDIKTSIGSAKWNIWNILFVLHNVWIISNKERWFSDQLSRHDALPEILSSMWR